MSDQNIAPAIHERKGHTPGPWHVVPYGDGDSLVICEDEAGNMRIAFMAVPGARDQQKRRQSWKWIKANARLIAAAPELLEALRPFAAMAAAYDPEDGGDDDQDAWAYNARPTIGQLRRARSAITKAEAGQ